MARSAANGYGNRLLQFVRHHARMDWSGSVSSSSNYVHHRKRLLYGLLWNGSCRSRKGKQF